MTSPIEYSRKLASTPQAPLASAWLRVSLALHGVALPLENPDQAVVSNDILLAAVEALGAEGGNAHLLRPNGDRKS